MIAAALNERGGEADEHQRAQAGLLRGGRGKPLPVGRDKDGTIAMCDQHGVPTVDIELAWSAMVLLPSKEWATVKCFEGQIREQTLHQPSSGPFGFNSWSFISSQPSSSSGTPVSP
jgi:hypothetical protein